MTKNLINYLTFILFLIPFTLLIVDNNVLFPFITTKALIFRSLVVLGLVFALWLYLLNPGTFPQKNYLFLAIVLFFIANLISTIFSVHPYRSFWGNAERMEGLWSLFFYLAYFFLLLTLFQFNPKAKKTIFLSILIVTTIISLIEINQAFVLKQERPSATLGNPTYIGFMNLLTIFLIFYFLFENKFKISDFKTFLYLILILINLISLIASQTRGSILGLLTGIFAGTVFYLLFSEIQTKKKILIFTLFFLFLVAFYFFLQTELSLKIPGLKRIAETLQNPASVFPRLYAWKIFLNAFKQRPIFGWGPETEPLAFIYNFDPRLFLYEQALFDRPHNKFIEILVKTGIFGFITWFFIFLVTFYDLFKKRKSNLLQATSLFSFLFAYLGQNFSLFDMQASYLLFFFGLSLITEKIDFKENQERFIRPYLILFFGLAFIFLIINLQHYYVVNKIISALRTPDPEKASNEFLRLSHIAGPFLTEEAIMASNYLFSHTDEIKKIDVFLNFYKVIKTAYEKDPEDYRLNNVYLNILYLLIDVKKQLGLDPQENLEEVKRIYASLIRRSPYMPEIYLNYARFFYKILGDRKSALDILKKGEKIGKIYPKYFFEASYIYFLMDEKELAYQKLKEALDNKFTLKTDFEFQLALSVYLANNDVENSKKIISLWLKQNNTSSIKENIKKILETYQQSQLLELDK